MDNIDEEKAEEEENVEESLRLPFPYLLFPLTSPK